MKLLGMILALLAGCVAQADEVAKHRFSDPSVTCWSSADYTAICARGGERWVCFINRERSTSYCIPAIDPLYLERKVEDPD